MKKKLNNPKPCKIAGFFFENIAALRQKRGGGFLRLFFHPTKSKLSRQGQKWLKETMVNLQVAMEKRLTDTDLADGTELELNQQDFKDFAFDSHVAAYWNERGSAPLYTLSTVDLFAIVLTPDFNDLTSKDGMTQAEKIMGRLGEYWVNNPKVAIQRAVEFGLNKGKIERMIAEKAGTEMGDRAKFLYEQLKSYITNPTEQ